MKSEAFGGQDSHLALRYSFLDSHSGFVQPRLRSTFDLLPDAPLPNSRVWECGSMGVWEIDLPHTHTPTPPYSAVPIPSVPGLSPVEFSAHPHSISQLLRTV